MSYCFFQDHDGFAVCQFCGIVRYQVTLRECESLANRTTMTEAAVQNSLSKFQRRAYESIQQICSHLGKPTGEIELIQCRTCQGNVRLKFPVHECKVFGKCLPGAGNHPDIQVCTGCPQVMYLPIDTLASIEKP